MLDHIRSYHKNPGASKKKKKKSVLGKIHSISLKMQQILERHMRSNHDNLEEKSDALL
jgi:hypothetical protein